MQYWTISNKFIASRFFTGGMCGLLMIMVTSAIAANVAVDSKYSQYPGLRVAGQSNPWALPQTQQNNFDFRSGFQQQPYDYYQQYRPAHQWQPQAERFVTPEFLESLKQQQKQHQLIPENQQYHQPVPRQFMQKQRGAGLPGQGIYSYPSYDAGSANPLYDAPAVSPWGNGTDEYNVFNPFTFLPDGGY